MPTPPIVAIDERRDQPPPGVARVDQRRKREQNPGQQSTARRKQKPRWRKTRQRGGYTARGARYGGPQRRRTSWLPLTRTFVPTATFGRRLQRELAHGAVVHVHLDLVRWSWRGRSSRCDDRRPRRRPRRPPSPRPCRGHRPLDGRGRHRPRRRPPRRRRSLALLFHFTHRLHHAAFAAWHADDGARLGRHHRRGHRRHFAALRLGVGGASTIGRRRPAKPPQPSRRRSPTGGAAWPLRARLWGASGVGSWQSSGTKRTAKIMPAGALQTVPQPGLIRFFMR